RVTTNESDIATNESDITALEGRVDLVDTASTGTVAVLAARVTTNESDITAAETRLDDLDTASTGRVSVLEDTVSGLGSTDLSSVTASISTLDTKVDTLKDFAEETDLRMRIYWYTNDGVANQCDLSYDTLSAFDYCVSQGQPLPVYP
ncbi:hypothetical protein KIPB_009950, partial [Kipferlia bialata]